MIVGIGGKRGQTLAGLNRVKGDVGNEVYGSSSAYRRMRTMVDTHKQDNCGDRDRRVDVQGSQCGLRGEKARLCVACNWTDVSFHLPVALGFVTAIRLLRIFSTCL